MGTEQNTKLRKKSRKKKRKPPKDKNKNRKRPILGDGLVTWNEDNAAGLGAEVLQLPHLLPQRLVRRVLPTGLVAHFHLNNAGQLSHWTKL
jgi:hypothetical protein